MSDSEGPAQQPTPSKTPQPSQGRPSLPERSDSEQSIDDVVYQSRSRSQSRRRRRQNQRQRAQQQLQSLQDGSGGGTQGAQAQSMAKIDEDQVAESQSEARTTMQPFERIGPDSTSMDGPVTHARAMRGEVPMRDGNQDQALGTAPQKAAASKSGEKSIMDEEGLKLRLELNLDIEIELKASIHGDLTLALLA